VLSCAFFFKFFMKNSCCRAHDWSKNVNSVKTTLYSGPKKSIWCPFSYFSQKKLLLLCPCFVKKCSFSKKKWLSSPRFVKKTSTLLKTQCSHVFFLIFHKHLILSRRYFVKKRQFCQNQNTWWAIKVHKMAFFSESSRKNRCSHTHILS